MEDYMNKQPEQESTRRGSRIEGDTDKKSEDSENSGFTFHRGSFCSQYGGVSYK